MLPHNECCKSPTVMPTYRTSSDLEIEEELTLFSVEKTTLLAFVCSVTRVQSNGDKTIGVVRGGQCPAECDEKLQTVEVK